MSRLAEYQPYFLAYATAHGMTPEAMAARGDRVRNIDFMSWIQAQWRAFRALRPDCFAGASRFHEGSVTESGRVAFGAWLAGGAA